MIIFFGAVLGAANGAYIARRRKGKMADILQYGFIYGMIFALIGLFISIFISRYL